MSFVLIILKFKTYTIVVTDYIEHYNLLYYFLIIFTNKITCVVFIISAVIEVNSYTSFKVESRC